MNRLLAFVVLTFIPRTIFAIDCQISERDIALDYSDHATHIARIGQDTIVVISGSTYSYTVDTPEDQGFVSTHISVQQLYNQIKSSDGSLQKYRIVDTNGEVKTNGPIATGDRLIVTTTNTHPSSGFEEESHSYYLLVRPMALSGQLRLAQEQLTVHTNRDLTIYFTAGQRTPDASVRIFLPPGMSATMDNTLVNVIGRGDVKLRDLATQSIGRVGSDYSYSQVGTVAIENAADGGSVLVFSHLDLRPANGPDLQLVIQDVQLSKEGKYPFKATYTTAQPEILTSAGTGSETAILTGVHTISDFQRVLDRDVPYRETPETYTRTRFQWTSRDQNSKIQLLQSQDEGKNWRPAQATIDHKNSMAAISGLQPNQLYHFRLSVTDGEHEGLSNIASFFSGKMDIKNFGVSGDGKQDDTPAINEAIQYLNDLGGGTLLFSEGTYPVRTVHLKSNVWLYIDKGATIKALKGSDAPESTWFSDKQYRFGLSPTDPGPYADPENWLTKQDVGHTFFRNTLFYGERLDNVKIVGTGRITGDGNLVTSDKVMNRDPDNRADKMFTFKLCTNIEIGGEYRPEDLWYDMDKDEPYYLGENGMKIFDVDNMLHIDQAGHFVLLATGTDHINVHDTYFARHNGSNARDIYDFMGCNNVFVTNIYSKVSSDDIVKLGSDCSLGYTRPSRNFLVRNIIGDTNCNLFQIGSETADDITDVHVDNIFVLGANKAGFSISTNDGGHVKNIHLNCGHTGTLHSRSKMYRTRAPFFISISNRARILGASIGRYKFDEHGVPHDELLVKNVNIGEEENIQLKGVDIYEVYGGSSYRERESRWIAYDGTQHKATAIVAGYKLPDSQVVEGSLDFKLPNGKHTGYIKNIVFNDVHILVKGGNPVSDTLQAPPELGVGQYNVSNLKVQPSYCGYAM